jgi:poly-D-alanine transfer protein DltD
MGISDDYYNKYIHGRTGGHIEPVKEKFNQELEDFKMLMKLLKEKKVNASFIISPLNTLYFHNIKDILPIIKIIEYEINYNGFPYINLLETDPNKYDKAILNDIMHMSDYAWYKIDRFIIDTYHLNK